MKPSRPLAGALSCALATFVAGAFACAPAAAAPPLAGPVPVNEASAVRMEGMFRAGMQALKAGDMETAIRAFREMLSVEPGLVRVRLELGRALFTAKQYSDASDEFTLALSGKLPDEARQYVLQYLRAIEARSDFTWDFSVGFGLAPELFRAYQSDTLSLNFLGAPLEFTLKREDEDARLAISVTGSAEYRKEVGTIGEDTKVVAYVYAGADGTTRDVNPQDLRTLSLTARSGARIAFDRSTLNVYGNAQLGFRNNDQYEDVYTLNAYHLHRFEDGLSVNFGGGVGYAERHGQNSRSGAVANLAGNVVRTIDGRAYYGASAQATRRFADFSDASYTQVRLAGLGGYEFEGGYSMSGEVFALHYVEDGPLVPFSEVRQETELGINLKFKKNDLYFAGFTPYVTTGFSHRMSSISAYAYDEGRFQVGIERAF